MKLELISILVFLFLFIIQIFLGFSIENTLITSLVVSIIPYFIYQTIVSKMEEEKEENFIRFATDLADLLRTGLTLPVALGHLEKSDYGSLNSLIRNLSARIDWGIGTIEAFNRFAEESNNKTISMIIKNIINIYTSGGSLAESLEASVKAIKDVRKLKKQRESMLYENVLHSYIVFLFFLATSVVLIVFLLPFLDLSLPGETKKISSNEIINSLYLMSVIQAFFAGLIIGKMYKGSYKAGLKHSLMFIILTLIVFKVVLPLIPKGPIAISLIGNV